MGDKGAGLMKVTVEKATGLPAKSGHFDKTDPYCKLTLKTNDGKEGESYKTDTKDNAGSDPTWDQTFTFNKKEDEDVLEVKIYDDDVVKDDVLCERLIDLDSIKSGKTAGMGKSTPYQLAKDGKEIGQIFLKIEFDI